MDKKYGIMGLILVVILTTVLISGCIGSGETETSTTSDNNSSNDSSSSSSMSLEDKFIQTYDSNGDSFLDSSEFPYSKFSEINSKEQFDPYPSIQDLIEDYDIDQNHKLSADELKNIVNLNL